MRTHDFNNQQYKLTRNKNGGQFSGPCPWSGGRDRFTIEPNKRRWFCRECNPACKHGKPTAGGYRAGWLSEVTDKPIEKVEPVIEKPISQTVDFLTQATQCHERLSPEGRAYLMSRGIFNSTIRNFMLGSMGNTVTIPLLYHGIKSGELCCNGIKRRWIQRYKPPDSSSYIAVKGSNVNGIFNFDVLARPSAWGVIANSLFDVMLLHQARIPVIGPFASESSWNPEWNKFIQWQTIINIGDWDTEHIHRQTGKKYRPGTNYMLNRSLLLQTCPQVKTIINTYPLNGATDVNAMYHGHKDLREWIFSLLEE